MAVLIGMSKRAVMEAIREELDEPAMVSFTLDDGVRSQYTEMLPVFRKYGAVGTIFIITSRIGAGDYYMTWDHVREFYASGWEVGSHTVTHTDLRALPDDQLVYELVESKNAIRDNVGVEPTSLAYPYGYYDPRVKMFTAEHYVQARATWPPIGAMIVFPFLQPFNPLIDPYAIGTGSEVAWRLYGQFIRVTELLKRFGGWLVLVYHQPDELVGGVTTLEKVVKKLAEYGVEFVTFEEGARRFFRTKRVNRVLRRIHDYLLEQSVEPAVLDDICGWVRGVGTIGIDVYPYLETPTGDWGSAIYFPYIPVREGQRVFVSAELKADENIESSHLKIEFYSMSRLITSVLSEDFGGNYDWTLRHHSAVAPAGTVFARVSIVAKALAGVSGRIYWRGVTASPRVYPTTDSDYVLRVRTVA
jgi:Predicted xylanase/chitin deacetylase